MRKLAFAAMVLAVAGSALAQGEKTGASGENPMAGWKPPKITNEQKSRQEIQAFLKQFEAAGKRGDVDAAAALLDFPVLMVTDNSKGDAMADTWTKEKWVEQMRPFYAHPMPAVTNKPTITMLSDSLAVVTNQWSTTKGKQKMSARDALQVVRVGGNWRIKSMTEGGWGDTMGTAASASTGGAASTGTGSMRGTGSSTGTGGAEATPPPAPSPGTGGTGGTENAPPPAPSGTGGTETAPPPAPSPGTPTQK